MTLVHVLKGRSMFLFIFSLEPTPLAVKDFAMTQKFADGRVVIDFRNQFLLKESKKVYPQSRVGPKMLKFTVQNRNIITGFGANSMFSILITQSCWNGAGYLMFIPCRIAAFVSKKAILR